MADTLELRATVLPGGRLEIVAPELPDGREVEVSVRLPDEPERGERHSALDVLDEAPGGLLFRTVEEVDEYIREERAAWGD
jgi:hypothetical protein